MPFDMQKYDEVRFHSDELTHKRIKVLLLWFEYEVYKKNPSAETQVKLMERWIDTLVKQEYYEVVPFFRNLKSDMIKNLKAPKEIETDNVSEFIEKESFLTMWWNKIKKYIHKLK